MRSKQSLRSGEKEIKLKRRGGRQTRDDDKQENEREGKGKRNGNKYRMYEEMIEEQEEDEK